MRVNIVVGNADMAWIAGRLARELVDRLPVHGIHATINMSSHGGADLHYHQIVYGEPERRPAVGMFTHGAFRPHRFASSYDGQVALNFVMLAYCEQGGAASPALIELPVGDQFRPERPIVFGVAGRTYSDGRKGEHLVAEMIKAGYTVRAWGSGWPCQISSSDLSDLPAFYRGLDYYVDTSTDEGGCIPALECMAMGVPVISHTVGVNRPVLGYEMGDWDSLRLVLEKLTRPRTYDDWAREHAEYFKAIMARVEVAA